MHARPCSLSRPGLFYPACQPVLAADSRATPTRELPHTHAGSKTMDDTSANYSRNSSSSNSAKSGRIDACYAFCRVDVLQQCVLDREVIIHTYDQHAPTW